MKKSEELKRIRQEEKEKVDDDVNGFFKLLGIEEKYYSK